MIGIQLDPDPQHWSKTITAVLPYLLIMWLVTRPVWPNAAPRARPGNIYLQAATSRFMKQEIWIHIIPWSRYRFGIALKWVTFHQRTLEREFCKRNLYWRQKLNNNTYSTCKRYTSKDIPQRKNFTNSASTICLDLNHNKKEDFDYHHRVPQLLLVFRIHIQIRIRNFLCLPDPDTQLVAPIRNPDPSNNNQKLSTILWLLYKFLSLETDVNVRYLG